MMLHSLTWTVYFLAVLMNMRDALICLGILISFITFGCAVRWLWVADEGEDTTAARNSVKWCIGGLIGVIALSSFFPTERQIVLMASAEVIERTNIIGKVEGISADATDLLKKWIERESLQITNDMKKDTKK